MTKGDLIITDKDKYIVINHREVFSFELLNILILEDINEGITKKYKEKIIKIVSKNKWGIGENK
ncbi:hypothetical protein [Clostridium haemolyticum]|uniref:Uncharacterized protein n=1 Tax=Clostridium haemolyticum NCTC 9693 TaxID=1443114 RepID=A0ABR4TGX7_CLOHA|nr:hypothetical protein [Clostridium haemolyticum]KEI18264.1 hypothetical protein Z960_03890 [Clostridium haemolyticum NCTC 9693]KGN04189.1 hypothetical protein Z961_04370 [Clostridium haemolyticum NCTC 8350]